MASGNIKAVLLCIALFGIVSQTIALYAPENEAQLDEWDFEVYSKLSADSHVYNDKLWFTENGKLIQPTFNPQCLFQLLFRNITYGNCLVFPSPLYLNNEASPEDLLFETVNTIKKQATELKEEAPDKCHYMYNTNFYLVCDSPDMVTLPNVLPSHLLLFELKNTKVKSIPARAFNGSTILVMNVQDNALTQVAPFAFQGIIGLQFLSLGYNVIELLRRDMFVGLKMLLDLRLDKNKITYNYPYPPLLMSGLNMIDTFNTNNQTIMPNLRIVNLEDNPLQIIPNDAFKFIGDDSSITDLSLRNCNISIVHPSAFSTLKHIVSLDLYRNLDAANWLNNVTKGLRHRNLATLGIGVTGLTEIPKLALSNIKDSLEKLNMYGNPLGSLISDSFPNLPQLLELNLDNCGITSIEGNTFKPLPNLIKLYIEDNNLLRVPPAISSLSKLVLLNLSGNGKDEENDEFKLSNNSFVHMKDLEYLYLEEMPLHEILVEQLTGLHNLKYLSTKQSSLHHLDEFVFQNLISLDVLDLSGTKLSGVLSADVFAGLNKLTALYMASSGLTTNTNISNVIDNALDPRFQIGNLANGNITGDGNYTNILILNIGSRNNSFKHLVNLETLYLGNNDITTLSWLYGLQSLHVLDLSYNGIYSWDAYLRGLESLNILELSHNRISSWDNSVLSDEHNLQVLSLSSNHINSISPSMMNDLRSIDIVDLSYNPFVCDCYINEFNILANSSVHVKKYFEDIAYTCTMGKEYPFKNISQLGLSCGTSEQVVNLTIVILSYCLLALMIISFCVVLYFKRWQIKYLLFIIKIRAAQIWANPKQKREHSSTHFEYDVFVSYCEKDRPWVIEYLIPNLADIPEDDAQIKVCLHERDFEVGKSITENIISCVDKSRTILLVVSQTFLKSQWCQFELHLAQHRLLESKRNGLILIQLEKISRDLRSRTLQYLMNTRTYIKWATDTKEQNLFWKRIRTAILNSKKELTFSHII